MILVPVSCDAPIYHAPRGTIFLIVTNCSIYLFELVLYLLGEPDSVLYPYYLHFGEINPVQWVTSIFLHAGLLHLLGNMIFLWTFGLIVEGKVGTGRFLIIYLAIGMAECAIGQWLMLSSFGAACGASAAILGLVAISLVWAPVNELKMVLVLIFFGVFVRSFHVTVAVFCCFTLVWEMWAEVYLVSSTSRFMSSAFCHLVGAGIGLCIAIWMLKSRRVDCEGYDLLSVLSGKKGQKVLTLEQEAQLREQEQRRIVQSKKDLEQGRHFIQLYLDHNNPDMAIGRFKALMKQVPGTEWDLEHLKRLIQQLIRQRRWNDACEYLGIFATLNPRQEAEIRLKQAEIQILRNAKPSIGLDILSGLEDKAMNERQLKKLRLLFEKASRQIEEGALELADDLP